MTDYESSPISGVAVVTGGGSGIGAACCRALAARGATVAVLDRSRDAAEAIAAELNGKAFEVDVADDAALMAVADLIEASLGPVEILVNSAGIFQLPVSPRHLDMADWDNVVRIDQRATYVSCVTFARAMVCRKRGSIINIASVAGMRSLPLHAYGPAKAAVIAMTGCLAAEWGPHKVRVNAVSPGYTWTEALQDAVDRGERSLALLEGSAALGRLVKPAEVARMVAFLASDDGSGMTGANIPVDCGWLVAPAWQTYGGLRASGEHGGMAQDT